MPKYNNLLQHISKLQWILWPHRRHDNDLQGHPRSLILTQSKARITFPISRQVAKVSWSSYLPILRFRNIRLQLLLYAEIHFFCTPPLFRPKFQGVTHGENPDVGVYGENTIHQRHRQTEGQTTCDRKTALCTVVHRALKMSQKRSISVSEMYSTVCVEWTGDHLVLVWWKTCAKNDFL